MNTVCDDLVMNSEASRQGGLSCVQPHAQARGHVGDVSPMRPGRVSHTSLPSGSQSLSPGSIERASRRRDPARQAIPDAVDVTLVGASPVARSRVRLRGY